MMADKGEITRNQKFPSVQTQETGCRGLKKRQRLSAAIEPDIFPSKYFGHPAQPDGRLHDKLRQWVKDEEGRRGGAEGIPSTPRAMSLAREEGYLMVRLVSGSGASILIMEEILRAARQEELKALGLARQEARMLSGFAQFVLLNSVRPLSYSYRA